MNDTTDSLGTVVNYCGNSFAMVGTNTCWPTAPHLLSSYESWYESFVAICPSLKNSLPGDLYSEYGSELIFPLLWLNKGKFFSEEDRITQLYDLILELKRL